MGRLRASGAAVFGAALPSLALAPPVVQLLDDDDHGAASRFTLPIAIGLVGGLPTFGYPCRGASQPAGTAHGVSTGRRCETADKPVVGTRRADATPPPNCNATRDRHTRVRLRLCHRIPRNRIAITATSRVGGIHFTGPVHERPRVAR